MNPVRRARSLSLLVAVSVLAAACGSAAPQQSIEVVESAPATTAVPTSIAPPATTSAPPPTTTTTVRPPEVNETFVATIKPEIELLTAYDEPGGEPVPFEFAITNPTFFGSDLVLMVTDRTPDGEWLEVQIPVRPNGTHGWIPAEQAVLSSHFISAEINLTSRTVKVWDATELIAETGAVIGTAATPTPVGRFFVNDLVEKSNGSAYGPYILSLSGFSEALETFGGGIPVIAIHGTNNPSLIGGAYSNGCIRIPNETISFLAENVPMGTPVDIVA